MDLLLVTYGDKSHYVYIKDFDRFMFHKTKNKNKKYFCKSCLQCFSSKNVLTEHKEVCLSINGAQSIRLEKEKRNLKIILNKYQLHLNFLLILSVSYTQKKIKITLLTVLLTNLFVLMINLVRR